MSERRTEKRVPAQLKVWCEGEGFTLLAETLNVSHHGLFVCTSTPPPQDASFAVSLEELGVFARVRVCWVRGRQQSGRAGLGLEIIEIEQGAGAFQRYVERNSSKSGEHRLSWPPAGGEDPDPER